MTTFICTFTTGRSGTGFLSSVFGHADYDKRGFRHVGNNIVAHEPFHSMPIRKIKEEGMKTASKEGAEFIKRQIIIRLTKAEEPLDNIFVTDNKIGRYFGYSLDKTGYDYKILYVERNMDDTVRSFLKRYKYRQNTMEPETYTKFANRLWRETLYTPLDASTINMMPRREWYRMNVKQRMIWYWHETRDQWDRLKKRLPESKYMEVNMEDLHENLHKVSKFIGIPYDKTRLNVHVNPSVKDRE